VDWTQITVGPENGNGQQFYAPVVDPYNSNHLLMTAHEADLIIQSTDGGSTWTAIPMAAGMLGSDGTGGISFINTGNAATTAQTWLWLAQASGGTYGTWRTTNGGASWTRVDSNEHSIGDTASQTYQPDTSGVMFMAGVYSAEGWGVLRSGDFGQTWTHVGINNTEACVFGTPLYVYAMYGWGPGPGAVVNPLFELSATADTSGTWTQPSTPTAMSQGPAEVAVINNGTNYVVLAASYNAGLWRYVEP
jgi:hypothetical protein